MDDVGTGKEMSGWVIGEIPPSEPFQFLDFALPAHGQIRKD